ncbi:MAG: DUF4147 domain-containing protein [Algicola sp.]|nr:DUF4147 domain-containing protein [Algicola sp.]
MNTAKAQLISLFDAAIKAVSGKQAVINALQPMSDFKPNQIVAVGKAASDMALGALQVVGPVKTLVVTKYHHGAAELVLPYVTTLEAAHPIPDQNSLLAGQKLLETVNGLAKNDCLLLLVSGGASAVVECLPEDVSLEQWQTLTKDMIASGKTIAQINRKRKAVSLIKDGKLLQGFKGRQVLVLLISDVQGDDISTIGSGIGDCKRVNATCETQLVATNQIARQAIVDTVNADSAERVGLEVIVNEESLYDDVYRVSKRIATLLLEGKKGLYIFGGEPTIKLPQNPGNGGRNQSLALALAGEIAGRGLIVKPQITVLVAGTDGTDGPTNAAGAVVDGLTFNRFNGAQLALEQANAGEYLRQSESIFITGPTGTNVMDLVIGLVEGT